MAVASGLSPAPAPVAETNGRGRGADAAIRPERFARLVTLASVLIAAGRAGERLQVADVCEQLKISPQELREDVSVLNVVNFGGGAYVIYAEVLPTRRDRGRPGAVLGHVRPPGAAAADRGQGARGRDRPDRARPRGPALGAREGRRRARLRPGRGGPAHRLADGRRRHHAHRRARRAREPAARARVLDAVRGPLLRARRRAVRADQRPRGLVRRGLGPRARPAAALPAGPHQARVGADGALRAARGPQPDRRHRRLAAHRAGSAARAPRA